MPGNSQDKARPGPAEPGGPGHRQAQRRPVRGKEAGFGRHEPGGPLNSTGILRPTRAIRSEPPQVTGSSGTSSPAQWGSPAFRPGRMSRIGMSSADCRRCRARPMCQHAVMTSRPHAVMMAAACARRVRLAERMLPLHAFRGHRPSMTAAAFPAAPAPISSWCPGGPFMCRHDSTRSCMGAKWKRPPGLFR